MINGYHKLSNYPSLKYLKCQAERIQDFTKFTNLQTLVLYLTDATNTKLLNLPNIQTLIFRNLYCNDFCNDRNNYMFGNLPISLNNIIFICVPDISEIKLNNKTIKYMKQKMNLFKIPFGCKIYFIDGENVMHIITD